MKGTQGIGSPWIKAAIRITAALILTPLTLTIVACSAGAGGDYDSAWVGDIETSVNVTGSVGDGPAANAAVTIRKNSGDEIATVRSNGNGSFSADLKVSERHFPLLIDATGGTDIVTGGAPDFVLRGAVLSARETVTANVNPFSTFAYHIAMDLNGGMTRENLLAAEEIVVSAINSGLVTLAGSGPMRTPIDASNVAEIIKASETLAEVIRRTRDALGAAGRATDADQVIEHLASDLIDRVIEGNGGPHADARTAAVASIVAAQVTLEAMNNELHVNGANATGAMRDAIGQAVPGAVGSTLEQLTVTDGMISQAVVGLAAAYDVSGDASIAMLAQVVAGIQPGMEPALVRTMFPADYRSTLSNAVAMAAAGDATVVATINDAVRNNESSGSNQNRAPTISGQPPTSVQAGKAYEFIPVANDLDGDVLAFDIVARPSWASFDSMTGRLAGTPAESDAGTYDGVIITVSDGVLSSDVGPFTIVVTGNNTAPVISGSPGTRVTAGEPYSFTPRVTDPDSNVFRFTVTGKPTWASFDVLTGRLFGTPTSADVGTYRNIVISVTDGTATVDLPAFSIEVVSASTATGSATLNWTPPMQNEDGSQLVDLVAYRIYWSRDGGAFANSVRIDNPSVTRYVIENLAPGSYEFVATAINRAGIESRYSNAVTKVVQ